MSDKAARRNGTRWRATVRDVRPAPDLLGAGKRNDYRYTAVVVDLTGNRVRVWGRTFRDVHHQAADIRRTAVCPYCGKRVVGVGGCSHECMLKHWATIGERQRSQGEQMPLVRWVDQACDECRVDLSLWSFGENVPTRCESCIPLRVERQALRNRESNRRADRKRRANFQGERRPYSDLAVFERDNWICHLCGDVTDHTATWPDPSAPTIDHLVPLSLHGDDTEENVATAHWKCNRDKRNRFVSVRVEGHLVTGRVSS
jgi:5-methylcytosine-specific restriction endonuclease McrA